MSDVKLYDENEVKEYVLDELKVFGYTEDDVEKVVAAESETRTPASVILSHPSGHINGIRIRKYPEKDEGWVAYEVYTWEGWSDPKDTARQAFNHLLSINKDKCLQEIENLKDEIDTLSDYILYEPPLEQ